jgi:hypothetical protein
MMQTPPARMSSWINKIGEVVRMPAMASRQGHGGTAWSLPFAEAGTGMMQPQDGATETRSKLSSMRAQSSVDGLHEPEDARLTGGTRSLDRRLLGLNVLNAYVRRTATAVKVVKPIVQVEVA